MNKSHVSTAISSLVQKGWISHGVGRNFRLDASCEGGTESGDLSNRRTVEYGRPKVAGTVTPHAEKVTNSNRKVTALGTESSKNGNSLIKDLEQKNKHSSDQTNRFIREVIDGIKFALGVSVFSAPAEREWAQHAAIAFENGFTVEEFVGCFAELINSKDYSIRPQYVSDQLPTYAKNRRKLISSRLPSIHEKIADDSANQAGMIAPPRPKAATAAV